MYNQLYVFSTCLFCLVQKKVFNWVNESYDLSQKQRSYVISLFASSMMTLMSFVSNYHLYTLGFNMNEYRFSPNSLNEVVSTISSALFMSTMIMDSAIGYYHYPEAMKVLSGYPHHAFFIFANFLVYYYEGYTLANLFLIDELPTMILALGSVFPSLRSDWVFGMTMMCVRILYHGGLTLLNITYLPAAAISLSSLCAYTYWFRNWCKKYL